MMKSNFAKPPLALITVLMIAVIAALAACSLVLLRRAQDREARANATEAVINRGQLITAYLSGRPAVVEARTTEPDWSAFAERVDSLHTVEHGLQYVSVVRDGVIVFHTQVGTSVPLAQADDNVVVGLRSLGVGTNVVPVVTFSVEVVDDAGKPVIVEAALRRDTLEREETAPVGALSSMFDVSLATVVVSFAICVAIVGWMMHRETIRERHLREQEHLTFAGVMANGIVHDFRNPMSSLQLDVQMLERETGREDGMRAERVKTLAARARKTVDRMDKVFQEFFQLARPNAQERSTLDLAACVQDCLELLTPRTEQAHIETKFASPSVPLRVRVDPISIRRALLNIITNAVQFAGENGTIALTASRHGTHADLYIEDSGPGIPEADRKRVFDMFITNRPGGTGLGLFLARTAIESSGGSIRVADSELGGSRFHVRLPLAEQEST